MKRLCGLCDICSGLIISLCINDDCVYLDSYFSCLHVDGLLFGLCAPQSSPVSSCSVFALLPDVSVPSLFLVLPVCYQSFCLFSFFLLANLPPTNTVISAASSFLCCLAPDNHQHQHLLTILHDDNTVRSASAPTPSVNYICRLMDYSLEVVLKYEYMQSNCNLQIFS